MGKAFASSQDLDDMPVQFTEIGKDVWAFTAGGDPNTGVVIGDDSVMVIEAQATPLLANKVITHIREITDKPITHLVLTHYHAVRVLGACAYAAPNIIMSEMARAMIVERGQADWESEFERFPRLFKGHEAIPGLTWPTTTFNHRMRIYLGQRRVDLIHLGRAHTAGDIVVHIPDANIMLTGDIVECRSACYCGDGHFHDWPNTLGQIRKFAPDAILPGRGDPLITADAVNAGLALTEEFLRATYDSVAPVAISGGSLKQAFEACRAACDHRFATYAIYEHCLPFNVARAYDEARDIDTPRIWTTERDKIIWQQLQG